MVRFGNLPSAKAQSGSRLDPCRGKRPQHIPVQTGPVQTGRKSSLRYLPACEGGVVVIFAYLCSFKTDCTLQLWCGYLDSKVYSVKTAVLVPSVPAGLCESLIDLKIGLSELVRFRQVGLYRTFVYASLVGTKALCKICGRSTLTTIPIHPVEETCIL